MNNGFAVADAVAKLTDHYPAPDVLRAVVTASSRRERRFIARLWLSEGIPCAFAGCPMVYENVREWLGARLNVDAKAVTLVGSARLGYSLAPRKYANQFRAGSDLDFVAISAALFSKIAHSLELWRADVDAGIVRPRNSRAATFWSDNLVRLPASVERGFIDVWKIPTLDRYPDVQHVEDTMWLVHSKLQKTAAAPRSRKASIRVYRDWDSFCDQVSLSIRAVGKSSSDE